MKFTDLTNQKFGRLTVVSKAPSKKGNAYWNCECECGNTATVRTYNLTKGIATSCGCFRKEKLIERSIAFNTFIEKGNITEMYDTKGNMCLVDTSDVDKLKATYWCMYTYNYWISQRQKFDIKLHRYVMDCPDDLVIDHIDGNPCNNTKSNLRICTQHQNMMNTKIQRNNTTGVKGVTYVKRTNKYMVRIKYKGKNYFLGYYDTLDKAREVREQAEIKYFGEFRRK